ncbi:MAG: amidohydrolase [Eubacterium sp.]|nr:amidohydrolase [Eubacterium sp.]
MKKLFVNGKFCTMNDNAMWAEAVAVEDGRFTFVGTMDELAAAGIDDGSYEKTDLGGRFVIPGIVDTHQHIGLTTLYSGMAGNEQPYILTHTKAEALVKIKEFIDRHPEYDRYKCSAGSKEEWGETLSVQDLDAVCPDKPLGVCDAGGHRATANSCLMKIIGLDESRKDPVPNFCHYGRDKEGKLDGSMFEYTQFEALAYLDTLPHETIEVVADMILDYNSSRGITGLYDAGILWREDEILKLLRDMDDRGKIPAHYAASHTIYLPSMVDDAISEQLRVKKEYEGGNLTIDTMKIFVDGTAAEFSAFVKEPYAKTGTCAGALFSFDEMYKFFVEANEKGVNLHLHCIGDAAAERIADVVEKIFNDGIDFKVHVTLAHCELITYETLAKIKKYGIFIDMTPSWLDGPVPGSFWYQDTFNFSKENQKRCYELRTNMEHAGNFTLSSDCPVSPTVKEYMWNPYYGMEMAVTRYGVGITGPDEECCGGRPDERLTIEEALRAYTINGAIQQNWEDECGSIEVGKSADFAVLDRDLYAIPATEIHETLPELVVFRGNQVFPK